MESSTFLWIPTASLVGRVGSSGAAKRSWHSCRPATGAAAASLSAGPSATLRRGLLKRRPETAVHGERSQCHGWGEPMEAIENPRKKAEGMVVA